MRRIVPLLLLFFFFSIAVVSAGTHGSPTFGYIAAAFNGDTNKGFQLYDSIDGLNFTTRSTTYTPCNAGGYAGGPGIAYFPAQGKIWAVFTNVLNTSTTTFDLAYSADGHTFTCSQQISFSSVISGASAWVIAPGWVHNPNGTPWLDGGGCPHVYATAGDNIYSAPLQEYEVHPTNCSDFSQAWSAPVLVTGTSLPTQIVQVYTVVSGSTISMYEAPLSGSSELGVGLLTGSTASLTSGFTVTQAPNYQGWGTGAQGQIVITLHNGETVGYYSLYGTGTVQQSIFNGSTWSSGTSVSGIVAPVNFQSLIPNPS
jgi:hypothetical protein